jgi:L-lactate dehydrogenase complex protein LldG
MDKKQMIETFTQNAEAVSAIVSKVGTLREALEYAVNICEQKEACALLASGCELPLSGKTRELCETKEGKILAAPNIDPRSYKHLEGLCGEKGIECIKEGLRRHLGGLDMGVTVCDWGIAETGSLVLDSTPEDVRLATMVAETHIAVLPVSKLKETAYDQEEELGELHSNPPNYTAFITGASRTADIERVLTLGVHGPLELHILLWEDK